MRKKIQKWDETILFKVQKIHSNVLSTILLAFSFIGNGGLIWFIVSGLLILNPDTSRYGLYTLTSLGLCALMCNIVIKSLVKRERPCDRHDTLLYLRRPIGSSFPSGHAATSFACIVPLIHMNIYVGLAAMAMGFLIAFSRVYFFVHYPSDVIFGILAGSAFGVIGIQIVRVFTYFVPIDYFMFH